MLGGCHLRSDMLCPEILGVPKMSDRLAMLYRGLPRAR